MTNINACSRCGRSYEMEADKSPFCQACRIAAAEQSVILSQPMQESADDSGAAVSRRNKIILWMKIAFIVLGVGLSLWNLRYFSNVVHPVKALRWGSYSTDSGTDKCVSNLWKAVSAAQQGERTVFSCPLTGRPYVVAKSTVGVIMSCPNPQSHNVKSISAGENFGVPVVVP